MGTTYQWASPEVIGRMTRAQLLMYLKTDETAPGGARPKNAFGSKAERNAFAAKVRKAHGIIDEDD